MSEAKTIITIATPDGFPDVRLPATPTATHDFYRSEMRIWQDVLDGGRAGGARSWTQLLNRLNQEMNSSLENAQGLVPQLESQLAARPALIPDSPARQFVLDLAVHSPEAAGAAIEAFVDEVDRALVRDAVSSPHIARGIVYAELLKLGVVGGVQDQSERSFGLLWPRCSELIDEVHDDHFKSLESIHANSAATAERSAAYLDTMRDAAKKTVEDSQQALEAAIAAHREKLAVQGAIQLWDEEANRRHTESVYFERDFYLSVVLALFALIAVPYILVFSIGDGLKAFEIPTGTGTVLLGLIAAAAFTIVSIPRYCYRRVLSARHLHLDAAQRTAMLRTFISLKADQHIAVDEYAALLAAIFKPASSGFVREDGAQVGLRDFARQYDPSSGS